MDAEKKHVSILTEDLHTINESSEIEVDPSIENPYNYKALRTDNQLGFAISSNPAQTSSSGKESLLT